MGPWSLGRRLNSIPELLNRDTEIVILLWASGSGIRNLRSRRSRIKRLPSAVGCLILAMAMEFCLLLLREIAFRLMTPTEQNQLCAVASYESLAPFRYTRQLAGAPSGIVR